MKALLIKTLCSKMDVTTTLAGLGAVPGDYRQASLQIRKIINIPDDIKNSDIIRLFNTTIDMTSTFSKQRFEFDFSELGNGKIIKK